MNIGLEHVIVTISQPGGNGTFCWRFYNRSQVEVVRTKNLTVYGTCSSTAMEHAIGQIHDCNGMGVTSTFQGMMQLLL